MVMWTPEANMMMPRVDFFLVQVVICPVYMNRTVLPRGQQQKTMDFNGRHTLIWPLDGQYLKVGRVITILI